MLKFIAIALAGYLVWRYVIKDKWVRLRPPPRAGDKVHAAERGRQVVEAEFREISASDQEENETGQTK
jgi:hypothetical protein